MTDERARIIGALVAYLQSLPVDRDCGCEIGRRWPRIVAQVVDVVRRTP